MPGSKESSGRCGGPRRVGCRLCSASGGLVRFRRAPRRARLSPCGSVMLAASSFRLRAPSQNASAARPVNRSSRLRASSGCLLRRGRGFRGHVRRDLAHRVNRDLAAGDVLGEGDARYRVAPGSIPLSACRAGDGVRPHGRPFRARPGVATSCCHCLHRNSGGCHVDTVGDNREVASYVASALVPSTDGASRRKRDVKRLEEGIR